MTLHLTLVTPSYVLQVSDRLVTLSPSGKAFDPTSNKNVIYHARDAIVTIGYSGLAYLEGVPTDQWIAQKLRGEEHFFKNVKRWAVKTGPGRQWLNIGQSVLHLQRELQAAFIAKRGVQQLVIAGWQWRRDRMARARPIVWEIVNSSMQPAVFQSQLLTRNRHWHHERKKLYVPTVPSCISSIPFCLSSIPDTAAFTKRAAKSLAESLRLTLDSPDESARLLINAVALAAEKSSGIGRDCMAILLPHPSSRLIEAAYIPAEEARIVVSMGDRRIVSPSGFSPWIVGPRAVEAPSFLVGSRTEPFIFQPFEVSFSAPAPPPGSGLLGLQSSQPRPADPSGGNADSV